MEYNQDQKTAGKYLQENYAAVVCAIQLEWVFLQHVTNNAGDTFAVVEISLQETFLPRLFFVKSKYLTPLKVNLSTMSVKKYGLGVQNLVTFVDKNI